MPELKIFISHKMPTDTELAREIGDLLALYGGESVQVEHAGQFRQGDDWREKIEKEISGADWLIYLFTDQDEDWGFCLFECGFFLCRMPADSHKKLVTLTRDRSEINDALKKFNVVPMTENTAFDLLKEIYHDDPWHIKPDLPDEKLRTTAKDIRDVFWGVHTIAEQRDVIPSITMEFDEPNRSSLESDVVPAGTTVSGAKQWQVLFGKDSDTGAWLWEDLTKDWGNRYVYEFLFARMMRNALEKKTPKGCMLSTKTNGLYRVSLRRYHIQTNKKYVFYFN